MGCRIRKKEVRKEFKKWKRKKGDGREYREKKRNCARKKEHKR